MLHLHCQQFWLCGAVGPQTIEILHVTFSSTANTQTTRWFLTQRPRRYQLDTAGFLVDAAD